MDTSSRRRGLTLAQWIVRFAAPLAPADLRDEWRQEWAAELAALQDLPPAHRRSVRRALGAFADALWLRQRGAADFDWIDDLRHGWRQLTGHLAFAVTAVGILAVGLGATVTMFSVTDQVLLRSLPYPDPDRIVTLWETRGDDAALLEAAPANFLDWRERATSFEYLAAADPSSLGFTGGSRPEVFASAKVTAGFFESFGVRPILGRFFTADEYQKGKDQVLVLGEAFWRQRFGADPSIVGRALSFEDGPQVVVGIAPAEFEPRLLGTASGHRNIWAPKVIEEWEPRIRSSNFWGVVGRLKAGVSLETARAELQSVARQLAVEYPRTNQRTGTRVLALRDHLVGNVRLAVALLTAAVVMVLLIACVNVINLLLARGSARARELAIRVALGARRGRIVRQLLTETLLLAAMGGLLGTLLAQWTLAGLARLGPQSVPWIDTLHIDLRATAFAAVITLLVALLSGALPAWRTAIAGLQSAGRATTTADPTQHRLRSALVVAEIALALILVCGAGLLIRSFTSLLSVDPGFQRDHVFVLQVFAYDHNPTPARLRAFFDRSTERLRALPAVQSVGAVSAMPFIEANINIQGEIAIVGRPPIGPDAASRAHLTIVTPGYFETLRIPLKRGRFLDARDGAETIPVALISEDLARHHWPPDDDPIGDRIRAGLSGRPIEVEVVGVVASLKHDSLDGAARDEIFLPHAQVPFGSMTFTVRTTGDPTLLIEAAKAEIWAINPTQTIYRTATLDELVAKTVSPRRFALAVLVAFALVALLLAAGGVYGVLSAVTTTRLREVGVRVALGASWWDIVRWVVGRGLTIAALGIALGLAGALGAGQLLRGFLYGVAPVDPVSVGAACALMLLAALLACYLPARRAASADPVEVLRAE
ncbi:MAG: ABC transporter permease [Acidobacteria bacterium]|nr:ABC transporter permease [Acidobacteriota bacterium]